LVVSITILPSSEPAEATRVVEPIPGHGEDDTSPNSAASAGGTDAGGFPDLRASGSTFETSRRAQSHLMATLGELRRAVPADPARTPIPILI